MRNVTLTGTGGNRHGLYITDSGQVSGTGSSVVSLFCTQGGVFSSNIRIVSSANGNALVLSTSQNCINNEAHPYSALPTDGGWSIPPTFPPPPEAD